MASSDDEGETVQNIVSDYKFIDGGADEELISFADLQLLSALLAEKPWERRYFNEDVKPPFIVDDVNEKEDVGELNSEEGEEADENEDSDSEEDDGFDSVCAICDNGGDIIICDGKCMRSFHKTIEDGEDSACDSLGLTAAELEAIKNVPFFCDNCKYKKHQCFVCGKLGSSDELSNPEVFCCVNGACGYFYHPQCVARIFHPADNAAAVELQNKIAAGEPLTCPIHRCHVCNEVEMRSIDDMQFAVCRRCPKAYHRKCLPRDHEIDEDLLTPSRDHLKFPGPRQENRKMRNLEYNRNKNMSAGRVLASGNDAGNRISSKKQQLNDKVRSNSRGGGLSIKRLEELPVCSSNKRQKLASTRDSREKLREFTTGEGALSSVYGSYDAFRGTDSELVKSSKVLTKHGEVETTRVNPTENRTATICTLDADARRR